MPMTIKNKFEIGQTVYLVTDPEQLKRIVTAIKVTANGILYILALGSEEGEHYLCEISEEKEVI
jgi:hypothetical protein